MTRPQTITDVAAIPCPGCGDTVEENIDHLSFVCLLCGEPRIPINPTEPVMMRRYEGE